jgi:CDP-paratose 2-epimerase
LKYFITGGCGFLGSNIAASVLQRGQELIVFDNLTRFGSQQNLDWLKEQGDFNFVHGDVRNQGDVERAIKETKPDVIFHLAGQVAMTTSIDNPRMDFEVNALGTLNLLEAVRQYSQESIIIYSSTNKVYGDLVWVKYEETETRYVAPDFPDGFPETIPLDFHSPYGCSKGAADQYMLDYARVFGLRTVVFRHSSMYGGRQFATYDQGWIGWFCMKALEMADLKAPSFTISGNGKQVRDVLHADDLIAAYLLAVRRIDWTSGHVYNIGGGSENSLSLLELFHMLERMTGHRMRFTSLEWRLGDQKVFVACVSEASQALGWKPRVTVNTGIQRMLEWCKSIS